MDQITHLLKYSAYSPRDFDASRQNCSGQGSPFFLMVLAIEAGTCQVGGLPCAPHTFGLWARVALRCRHRRVGRHPSNLLSSLNWKSLIAARLITIAFSGAPAGYNSEAIWYVLQLRNPYIYPWISCTDFIWYEAEVPCNIRQRIPFSRLMNANRPMTSSPFATENSFRSISSSRCTADALEWLVFLMNAISL